MRIMCQATVRHQTVCIQTPLLTIRPRLQLAQDLHYTMVASSDKRMTEGPGAVAVVCNNHHSEDTLRISADKKTESKVKAGFRSKIRIQNTAKSKKENGQDNVKAEIVIIRETQITAEKQD